LIEERPIAETAEKHPTWTRLTEELGWYDRASMRNQQGYKVTKTVQIILAACIPIVSLAGADWSAWGAAVLGALSSGSGGDPTTLAIRHPLDRVSLHSRALEAGEVPVLGP
jgi:hypothetical protein